MSSQTLVILAAGGSRAHVVDRLDAMPSARLWTLNGLRHPRAELHFEIHWPHEPARLDPRIPAIVSPFAAELREGDRRFPLAAASALGAPFLELTHDYLLAYAALLNAAALPAEARPAGVSGLPLCRIVLAGVDLSDRSHYAQSRGAHFWLGLLRGQGVEIETLPGSTLLSWAGPMGAEPIAPQRPYYYGQPREEGGNVTWR